MSVVSCGDIITIRLVQKHLIYYLFEVNFSSTGHPLLCLRGQRALLRVSVPHEVEQYSDRHSFAVFEDA